MINLWISSKNKGRRIMKTLLLVWKLILFPLVPLSPSPFYKFTPTWMNMKYFSLLWKGDWEKKRVSWEHSIFQGNRCLIPLAHPPTSYHYNFSSFYSFVLPKHPLLYLLQLSPARLQKGSQHTCLSSVIHRPRKSLPSHSEWKKLPKKRAKQPNK